MAGCLNHLESGVCDPNCPEKVFCHYFAGWNLDGRPVIFHTHTVVSRLADGGINDSNVDRAITIGRDEAYGKHTRIIPIETLRRGGV